MQIVTLANVMSYCNQFELTNGSLPDRFRPLVSYAIHSTSLPSYTIKQTAGDAPYLVVEHQPLHCTRNVARVDMYPSFPLADYKII